MAENNAFSEESLYEIARSKVNFRLSVKVHVGIFIVVSALLLTINLIQIFLFSPNILWVLYPFFGWFIGVVLHTTAYIVYARGVYPIAKRGVIFHTLAFIFVMLYLFIINLITIPYPWAIYPLIFWGSALVIHNIAYLVLYRGKIDDKGETKSRRERAIEKEMEKMRKRMKK